MYAMGPHMSWHVYGKVVYHMRQTDRGKPWRWRVEAQLRQGFGISRSRGSRGLVGSLEE